MTYAGIKYLQYNTFSHQFPKLKIRLKQPQAPAFLGLGLQYGIHN